MMSIQVGPSGIAMPTGNITDFRLVQAEGFDRALPRGGWPGPYAATFNDYGRGWGDTAGKNMGQDSGYDYQRVIEVADSCLIYHLHVASGSVEGRSVRPNMWSANVSPKASQRLYGRYDVCMKAEGGEGWKTALLLWSDAIEFPGGGENDWPEGDFGGTLTAFMHHFGAKGNERPQDSFPTNVTHRDWRVYSIRWMPGRIEFWMQGQDGVWVHVGTSTGAKVPSASMHWQLQVEKALNTRPISEAKPGKVFFDWACVWEYAPGTVPSGNPTPPVVVPSGTFGLTTPPAVSPTTAAPGGTIAATATYTNDGSGPFTVNYLTLALRGPNGERGDLSGGFGSAKVIPAKGTQTVGGAIALPADAALGTWGVVSTWQGTDGAWHESDPTPFVVAATPPPPPVPAAPPPLTPMKTTASTTALNKAMAANIVALDARLRKAGY